MEEVSDVIEEEGKLQSSRKVRQTSAQSQDELTKRLNDLRSKGFEIVEKWIQFSAQEALAMPFKTCKKYLILYETFILSSISTNSDQIFKDKLTAA